MDVERLTELLREAEQHHGEYEPTAPKHHWSTWYAGYMVAREEGRTPEEARGGRHPAHRGSRRSTVAGLRPRHAAPDAPIRGGR